MQFNTLTQTYLSTKTPYLTGLHQQQVFRDIARCRTPDLGGHWFACPDCGHSLVLYNSCRNRHCPVCQGNRRRQWIASQCTNLLRVPYYHVVFTLPAALNGLCLYRPQFLYDILFQSAWKTLKAFFGDSRFLGGQGGMTAVLHTWGQTLTLHPHLHCIVPGAGLDKQGNFKLMRGNKLFLFPVKALSMVFRAKFVAGLTRAAAENHFEIHPVVRKMMFAQAWVVYCKRPVQKTENLINYLGRYIYRTAISESRITDQENGQVSFMYKDYADHSHRKTMTLPIEEFFRRFALHILPKGLVRVRHYGLLSNSCKQMFIEKGKQQAGLYQAQTTDKPDSEASTTACTIACPVCKKGQMVKLLSLSPQALQEGFAVQDGKGNVIFNFSPRDGPPAFVLKLTK